MLEVFQELEEEEQEEAIFPEEFEIDFQSKKLTGKKVSGNDALKVWCFLALQIERYRFRAFSWEYGAEFEELIGASYGRDFSESEIKRRITEALCVHPFISDVTNFNVSFEGERLSVSCTVETNFGSFELSDSETEVINV